MKIINLIIGFLIIVIGASLTSITVNNEIIQTMIFKFVGFVILVGGVFYLRKFANFRKPPNK